MDMIFSISEVDFDIEVSVDSREVVDYNEVNGFDVNDDGFDKNWVCTNVEFSIDGSSSFGQVQYDV